MKFQEWIWKSLLVTTLGLCGQSTNCLAQTFDITSIGEIDLDTDLVVTEGLVTNNFGMYVTGLGESFLRVTVGNQTVDEDYEFKVSNTRLVSYLFDGVLAEDISVAFRRGVFGNITIAVIDQTGAVSDSSTFAIDVTQPKRNCKKYKSSRLKRCARVNLATTSARNQKKLATEFAESIRGPIVLEP